MFVKTNTVEAINSYYYDALKEIYSKSEITVLLEIVFKHFLNFNKLDLKTKSQSRLSESELLDFHFTLKRLKNNEPIQYILGEAPFMGMRLKVDKNVLIPRPETEELVDWVSKVVVGNSTIMDIGTGSGCIPLSLKKLNHTYNLLAVDVDDKALNVAIENSKTLNLPVTYICQDILGIDSISEFTNSKIDCIISNPPYIGISEKNEMSLQVTEFEPHLALFVEDNDPMIFYKKIAALAFTSLPVDGHLFFESNQLFTNEVAEIMKYQGFKEIEIRLDINQNPRMIYGKK